LSPAALRIINLKALAKAYDEWHSLLERVPYASDQSLRETINDPQAIAGGSCPHNYTFHLDKLPAFALEFRY